MSPEVRIGIDCRMYSSKFTGIGRYVYELTHNLAKIDEKHHYVLFFNEPEYSSFVLPNERFSKVCVNARHYSFAEQVVFLYKLWRAKLDLMHFTHFNAPIFYLKRSIVTIHDLTLSFFPGNKMRSPIYRAAYRLALGSSVRNATSIIAVSNNTARDLEKIERVQPEKVRVIYEAVNEEFKRNENEEEIMETIRKIGISRPYILYTGVWRSHKNLVGLIRAFQLLKEKYHEEVQLVITGKDDPLYPEVCRAADESGHKKDIFFTGMVDERDLTNLYSGAHVYCLPSLYEGFGLSPLEAMKCGVPVAVSKTSCLPEICGDSALYFDPYDPTDIAEKLHTLCVNSDVRDTLIKNGLAHIKTFSWEKMAKETLEVYSSVLR